MSSELIQAKCSKIASDSNGKNCRQCDDTLPFVPVREAKAQQCTSESKSVIAKRRIQRFSEYLKGFNDIEWLTLADEWREHYHNLPEFALVVFHSDLEQKRFNIMEISIQWTKHIQQQQRQK